MGKILSIRDLRVLPEDAPLADDLGLLRGRRVFAVDGGANTVDLPIGKLIIGRAFLLCFAFPKASLEESLYVPGLPFLVLGSLPETPSLPQAISTYIHEAVRLVRVPSSDPRFSFGFFTDAAHFRDMAERLGAAATGDAVKQVAAAIDMVRNAAETVAFLVALKSARAGDIVLRDGRLHGSVAFWTRLARGRDDNGDRALQEFVHTVRDALDRGVRVAGIVKRPAAHGCVAYLRRRGRLPSSVGTDAELYRQRFGESSGGRRSTLWRYAPWGGKTVETPRQRLEQFWRETVFFYLAPGCGAFPYRVDIPAWKGRYKDWVEELAAQLYTLSRASGTAAALPEPITAADNRARVRREETVAVVQEVIRLLAEKESQLAGALERSLRTWLNRRLW